MPGRLKGFRDARPPASTSPFQGNAFLWPQGQSANGIPCPLTLTDLFTNLEFEVIAAGTSGTDLFFGLEYPSSFTDAFTLTADTTVPNCFGFIGALTYETAQVAAAPATETQGGPVQAPIEQLAFSFFYNVRDLAGNLIDKVAVPPAQAGSGFEFVTARNGSLDVGVAVFVTTPMSLDITVDFGPGGALPIQATTPQIEGQAAFFLKDIFQNELPDSIPGALVTVRTTTLNGEVYGVTVGQQIEGPDIQFAPQTSKVLPLQIF